MDDIALAALWSELAQDCHFAEAAVATAVSFWSDPTRGRLEATAHHIVRFFNIAEQMGLRVAKAFENNIDDEKGWHAELVRRMTLHIGGVRPAFWSDEVARPLHKIRGFRHVLVHAYDLDLDADLLQLQLKYAQEAGRKLRGSARNFVEDVAAMHGLTAPAE